MKTKLLLLVALCFALFALAADAADWLQFRGPGGQGISGDKDLPTTWDDTKNVVWKTKLPGPGGSSPIVLGDRVFVTCYTGYGTGKGGDQADLRRHLLCLDRRSGDVKWTKEVKAVVPETRYSSFITQHGYASSTPATDGERVYVFFGKSGVFAYDLDGKQLWKATVGTGTHGWGSASSPVLYKKLVIVNAAVESGGLVALNKTDGKQVWKSGGIGRSWGTPALVDVKDGKQELALSVEGKVLGLDPENGKELWHCEGIDDYICPSVVAKDGIVYAIGGRRGGTALAVRAGGRGDVTESRRLWTKNVGAKVPSPVVVGDYLYWVSDAGIAHCLKAATGEKAYGERLPSGGVYASAVAGDGKLYAVSREKGTFVLAAKPKFELLARNTFAGDKSIFNASPAVSNGQLFLRSDRYLYCVGKK